eukprot:s634_g24.t1
MVERQGGNRKLDGLFASFRREVGRKPFNTVGQNLKCAENLEQHLREPEAACLKFSVLCARLSWKTEPFGRLWHLFCRTLSSPLTGRMPRRISQFANAIGAGLSRPGLSCSFTAVLWAEHLLLAFSMTDKQTALQLEVGVASKLPTAFLRDFSNLRTDDGRADSVTELIDLRGNLDGLERERDYYFRKLRDVEILCLTLKAKMDPELTAEKVVEDVQGILYAENDDEVDEEISGSVDGQP